MIKSDREESFPRWQYPDWNVNSENSS